MRQSNARDEQGAFRALSEIHAEAVAWRGLSEAETRELLKGLADRQLVETSASDPAVSTWRATPTAVSAIDAAYADRHPMIEDASG
ncbi:hypothetical protein DSM104299_05546 [Baekduia alba]|nr:hypothetical protein DSM104299_05546 [Baekduia alba]